MIWKGIKMPKQFRPWQDSNLQSPDSESDTLSIRPQGRWYEHNEILNSEVWSSENCYFLVYCSRFITFGLRLNIGCVQIHTLHIWQKEHTMHRKLGTDIAVKIQDAKCIVPQLRKDILPQLCGLAFTLVVLNVMNMNEPTIQSGSYFVSLA